jgi:hypothetical protein
MSLKGLVEDAPPASERGEKMGEMPEEMDDLDLHLKTLLGRAPSPRQKEAFRAAVAACQDNYGEAETEEPMMG